MAQLLQLRRGTTAQHSGFTGSVGEVTVDTDKDVVVVHDGATAGGIPMIKNGTSEAATLGTIDLGHASDTTLSRSSAGVLAVEGVTVPLNGTGQTATFGTIELGHASDTSITRSSAGVIAVEGVTVPLNGTSQTATFGTVELGHASDTTLSRSSAGVIAVENVVVPTISSTNTLTNKRVTLRVGSTTSSATPTINTDNVDLYQLTAQAVDITSFTTNLSGTPTDGDGLIIEITGTDARAITWGTSFEASTVALPTTTVSTNKLTVGFVWNSATSKWRCIASV